MNKDSDQERNPSVAVDLDHYVLCPFRDKDINDCPLCKTEIK